jgi:hypothetical protein
MSMSRSFVTRGSGALLLLVCTACAHRVPTTQLEPIVTDRPDFTESAQTVAQGHTQLEAGQTFAREADVSSFSLGEVLLRTGVTRRVELRTAINSYAFQTGSGSAVAGFEDANIGAKLALLDAPPTPSWRPAVAVIAGMSVPTGGAAYRGARTHPEVKLLTAWDLSDRLAFSSNLNWGRAEYETGIGNEWSASASLGVGLTEKVGAYFETFGFGDRFGRWGQRAFVNGGVTYLISSAFQLDLRAGAGPSGTRGDFFTGVGLSRRW